MLGGSGLDHHDESLPTLRRNAIRQNKRFSLKLDCSALRFNEELSKVEGGRHCYLLMFNVGDERRAKSVHSTLWNVRSIAGLGVIAAAQSEMQREMLTGA